MLLMLAGYLEMTDGLWWRLLTVSISFLGITGILLVIDLDRPMRFLYVMLRPNWDSWLVKGAYLLGGFGGILGCSFLVLLLDLDRNYLEYLAYAGIPLALLTGIYTAWLLQQAKGRSWSKDRALTAKMTIEVLIAGAACVALLSPTNLLLSILAIPCLILVAWHGHRTVIDPQLETLH